MSSRSRYVVGAAYDAVFFLGAPVVAVVIGGLVALAGDGPVVGSGFGGATTVQALALRTLIHAHLVIVFARSHGNAEIFRRFPARFVVVPIVAFAAMVASPTVLTLTMGVVIVWDMVHSSLQTFGLARLYEVRGGGDAGVGRGADLWLNHAIYLGPFFAGPVFGVVVDAALGPLMSRFSWAAPAAAAAHAASEVVRVVAVVASAVAVGFYVVTTVRRVRAGGAFSLQKHLLYASTAVACLCAWGFDTFGQALLIVNVFHAVQYFGLVAHTEQHHLARRLLFEARAAALLIFLTLALAGGLYGFWFGAGWDIWLPPGLAQTVGLAVVNLVAMLHFWYDGFIWSVRKGDA